MEQSKLTKKDFEDYKKIGLRISALQDRIEKLKEMEVQYEHGAVKGSNPNFPYQPMSFHVSGYNIRDDDKRRNKIYNLRIQLAEEIKKEESKRLAVEEFINSIEDRTDSLIFTYYYLDKMSQEEIAKQLCIDQSGVSRRMTKYLKNA